jgi:hypothetical protein
MHSFEAFVRHFDKLFYGSASNIVRNVQFIKYININTYLNFRMQWLNNWHSFCVVFIIGRRIDTIKFMICLLYMNYWLTLPTLQQVYEKVWACMNEKLHSNYYIEGTFIS